ncbi:MAG TPA: Gfo/Idh/MocA family oxidoreductase [Terriglobales bacterium]|nr:Gfo/Idh/MocA family oxidoreductase [Terriglobales bacterium]
MAENTRRDFLKKTAAASAAFLAPGFASGAIGANDRVRIGIIGAGSRGQELLKQVVAIPQVQVVAAADVYTRRFDEAKKIAPGIQTFGDHRRLLDLKDIDGVIVATPLHIHARHFVDAIAAGKDLYAEKTMTWSIPEAEKCLSAARASNRVVQIGLQHQSGGPFADARKWLSDGIVGKITLVDSWMSRNTPHGEGQWVRKPTADCTAQNVNWPAFLNGRPDKGFDAFRFMNWRLYWMFSGGNVTENMIHQIAWIMSALDLPLPTSAYMSGGVFSEKDGREVPDTIVVTLDFPNEMVVTWQSTFSNRRYGLGQKFLGSDGTIEYIAGATDMVSGESEESIHYYPEHVNRPNGIALTGESPTQNHMANWIDCIRSRNTPNAPVELGYRSAIACHIANLAYLQKRRVTLEEAKAFRPEF